MIILNLFIPGLILNFPTVLYKRLMDCGSRKIPLETSSSRIISFEIPSEPKEETEPAKETSNLNSKAEPMPFGPTMSIYNFESNISSSDITLTDQNLVVIFSCTEEIDTKDGKENHLLMLRAGISWDGEVQSLEKRHLGKWDNVLNTHRTPEFIDLIRKHTEVLLEKLPKVCFEVGI